VCNDGNRCNGTETCDAATGCKAGTPLVCNDGNACNGAETCVAATGCKAGTPPVCNDGNKCNGTETCVAATGCKAGTPLVCSDGKFCNGEETCNSTVGCMAAAPVNCGIFSSACEVGVCDEASQACVLSAKADATPCDDGVACTTLDVCTGGTCKGASSCGQGETCIARTGVCALSIDFDSDGLTDTEDPCMEDARNGCAGEVAVDRTEGLPIRIKTGLADGSCAGPYTDCAGDVWYEDFGHTRNRGTTSCTLANGCALAGIDTLFGCTDAQTEEVFRCDHASVRSNRRITYKFDVPAGSYVVNLYFANTQSLTSRLGDRVFDISLQGEVAYPEFDQVEAAGGSGIAVVRAAIVEVLDDGSLTITLRPRVGQVAIKAIEVLEAP
jgi:hypothetical protein